MRQGICRQCGNEFTFKGKKQRYFCNSACYVEWMRENNKGDKCPAWRGKTTTGTCPICGSAFKQNVHRAKYCSMECYKVDLKKRLSTQDIKRCVRHGMAHTRIYRTWACMKGRATDPNHQLADVYYNRGIGISEDWMSFENFYADMGEIPEGMTIERIDNDKGYCKENCRWATPKEQNRNKRDTIFITFKDETLSLPDWADRINIKTESLYSRYRRGWSVERMLTQPQQIKHRKVA